MRPALVGDGGARLETLATSLYSDNQALLQQGINVIRSLAPDAFIKESVHSPGGSVGAHFRHCIEFYLSFVASLPSGLLDYDARPRELSVQTQPEVACAAMEGLIGTLQDAATKHAPEQALKVAENQDSTSAHWSASSVSRELRFLLSHTVHHYALISLLLKLEGVTTPETFGVAPSTLRHRERCAQ